MTSIPLQDSVFWHTASMKENPKQMNPFWCPMPWKGLLVRNNGEMRVCIQSQSAQGHGVVLDAQNKSANIKDLPVSELRNLPLLKQLRTSMIQGVAHPHCQRCDVEDVHGLPSARQQHRKFWENEFSFSQSALLTKEDGAIENIPLGFLDLRVGNHCNLKCRMCGPSESTGWYEEHFDTVGKGFRLYSGRAQLERKDGRVKVVEPQDWVNKEEAWKNLEAEIEGVRHLHIVGGEPFLESRHLQMLRRLVESGVAQNVILDYNSNLTVVPPLIRELWMSFAQIRIGASIDAVGKVNNYIRFPSDWETIEKNFLELAKVKGKVVIWPTTTVQILNVYEILDLYDWRMNLNRALGEDRIGFPLLKIHPVHAPAYYSIQALPLEEKQRVREAYQSYIDQLPDKVLSLSVSTALALSWQEEIAQNLFALLKFMESKDQSQALPEFWLRNTKMDLYRGQKFSEVYPDLAARLYQAKNIGESFGNLSANIS